MDTTQPTIYGAYLQTAQLLGLPMQHPVNCTMNQALGVLPDVTPTGYETPRLKYFGISNKGHYSVMLPGDILSTDEIPSSYTDAAMYNNIPFVVREVTDDLTPAERKAYRMRRLEVHGGTAYAVYYLKAIDITETVVKMIYREVADGRATDNEFIPTLGNLFPVPKTPEGIVNATNETTGLYGGTSAIINFTLTEAEVNDIRDACRILYGSEKTAIISKLGLYTGVDRELSGGEDNTNVARTEAIRVQPFTFISCEEKLGPLRPTVTIGIDVGILEPMYKFNVHAG